MRPIPVWAGLVACVGFIACAYARADEGKYWQPADVVPAQASTESIVALYHKSLGEPSAANERVLQFEITARSVMLHAAAHIRASDFRIDTTVEGADYASGRKDGMRWRRTPAGVVRLIQSDVQGDDLDRWPLAILGFDDKDCIASGASSDAAKEWILACRSSGDLPHWYYIDRTSGRIVREVSREGSRIVTYAFDDFREADGVTQAQHWHISGAGGDADVRVVSSQSAPVNANEVEIPPSASDSFILPPSGIVGIPAKFTAWDILIPVRINGRTLNFVVDTGTAQVLMDYGAAARVGLHSTLDHTIAANVQIGDVAASNLPIETVNLFGGSLAGILGNEFFIGHIVHIDYRKQRLELLARSGFEPPSDSRMIPVDFREGMPLAAAHIGEVKGNRFALDTGSPDILLSNEFANRAHSAFKSWYSNGKPPVAPYLEGSVTIDHAEVISLAFGPVVFDEPEVTVAKQETNDLDIPLDGVFGAELLEQFEWWFDYTGGRVWVRYGT